MDMILILLEKAVARSSIKFADSGSLPALLESQAQWRACLGGTL